MTEVTDRFEEARPRRFRPYPAYRDSGVEWLGEIPAHWEAKPAKAALIRNDSGVWGDDFDDDGTVVLRSTEQTVQGGWRIDQPARRRLSTREATCARLGVGDLLVTKSSGSAHHIGKTSIVDEQVAALNCCYSNFMQRLRVSGKHVSQFYWYFMNCPVAREQLVFLSSTTTGLGNLNGSILGAIRTPMAPPDEQRAIAAFLDRETAKTDGLVARMERLIELLHEKRTALITRAVTRGLDPDVPMKDSGVEWLGEIPAHWHLRPLKRVSPEITVGVVVNPSIYVRTDGVPFLYGSDIKEGRIVADAARRMSEEDSKTLSKSRLRAGDLVCVRVGAPGVTAVVPPELAGANCASVVIVRRPDSFDSQWLCYAMNSRLVRYQVELVQYGAAQEQFNVAHAVEFIVPLAPQAEQKTLADFLDRASAEIDALIAKIREAINHLNEFRTALISAAVTGKIDVREATPR